EPGLRLTGPDHPHPAVQRRQPVPGDGHRGLLGGQAGLDEPAEVREIAGSPVGLPAGLGRAGRVDPAQRLGHDGLAQRRRAPAPVRRDGEGHPGLLPAIRRSSWRHEIIMTCGLCSVRCRGRRKTPVKYLLLIYGNQEKWASIPAAEWPEAIARQDAFNRKYRATGELIGAYGLADEVQARLVRRGKGPPPPAPGPAPGAQEDQPTPFLPPPH